MIKLVDDLGENGGFTYNPTSDSSPEKGFVLSVYPERERTVPLDELTPEAVEQYLADNADLLAKDDVYFGGWVDTDKSMVYFDCSIVVQERSEADKLARRFEQLAYFDLGECEEIRVDSFISVEFS